MGTKWKINGSNEETYYRDNFSGTNSVIGERLAACVPNCVEMIIAEDLSVHDDRTRRSTRLSRLTQQCIHPARCGVCIFARATRVCVIVVSFPPTSIAVMKRIYRRSLARAISRPTRVRNLSSPIKRVAYHPSVRGRCLRDTRVRARRPCALTSIADDERDE